MRALFFALTMMACTTSEIEVQYRLHDNVQFKFTGENVFYSKACPNKGKIKDLTYFSSYGVKYLIEVECLEYEDITRERYFWVKQEDVLREIK
jgi:hypothetical protein